MRYFHNDYNSMCHPAVLEYLNRIADRSMPGYGTDALCHEAQQLVCRLCNDPQLSVHFLVGGTQANLTVIAAALRPHQAAVCAQTGHIHVHETGAVEATGHKILALPSQDGKLTADQVDALVCDHAADADREHAAQPKLVYISNPTELGTIYTLSELKALRRVCDQHGLYLFLDGARLGYGLTGSQNDLTLADIAANCDAFYIGLTKCGAMFGEAVVIRAPQIAQDFRYLIKQHGGMLAKGWLLGAQFLALFENDLYVKICARANGYADQLRQALSQKNIPLYIDGCTNQVFPILSQEQIDTLSRQVTLMPMDWVDPTHRAVRFCTSWATTGEDMQLLCDLIENLN